MSTLLDHINTSRDMFSPEEARAALAAMSDASEIMFAEDVVYKI